MEKKGWLFTFFVEREQLFVRLRQLALLERLREPRDGMPRDAAIDAAAARAWRERRGGLGAGNDFDMRDSDEFREES